MGLVRRLGMVTAMTTIKQGNYAREAKFVDDYWSKLRKARI